MSFTPATAAGNPPQEVLPQITESLSTEERFARLKMELETAKKNSVDLANFSQVEPTLKQHLEARDITYIKQLMDLNPGMNALKAVEVAKDAEAAAALQKSGAQAYLVQAAQTEDIKRFAPTPPPTGDKDAYIKANTA